MSANEPSASSSSSASARSPEEGAERSNAKGAGTETTSAAASTAPAEAIEGDIIALEFGVHKSLRYHAKRRAFFDFLHRCSTAMTVIAGSAALFTIIGDKTIISTITASIVVFFSSIDFVFAFPERAREHDRLYERFSDLAAKLICLNYSKLDAGKVNELRAERLILEKGEPSPLDALNVICHNEEAEARGYPMSDRYQIGGFQRLLAPFCTLPWFAPKQFHDA